MDDEQFEVIVGYDLPIYALIGGAAVSVRDVVAVRQADDPYAVGETEILLAGGHVLGTSWDVFTVVTALTNAIREAADD